jgi:probable HAF family extracellular repeat protein
MVGYANDGMGGPYHACRVNPSADFTSADFKDLGTLGGLFSFATAVSDDGSVVVGFSDTADNNRHAFRWTEAGAMVDLGSSGTDFLSYSRAFGVSADGSLVVGDDEAGGYPFIWTADSGLQHLDFLGSAYGLTPDGSVLIGSAYNADQTQTAFL